MKNQLCKVKCLLKLSQFEKADLELIRLGMMIKQANYELRPVMTIKYHLLKAIFGFKNQKIRDIVKIEDIIEPLRVMVRDQYDNEVYLKAKLEYLTAKMFKRLGFQLEAKNILSQVLKGSKGSKLPSFLQIKTLNLLMSIRRASTLNPRDEKDLC